MNRILSKIVCGLSVLFVITAFVMSEPTANALSVSPLTAVESTTGMISSTSDEITLVGANSKRTETVTLSYSGSENVEINFSYNVTAMSTRNYIVYQSYGYVNITSSTGETTGDIQTAGTTGRFSAVLADGDSITIKLNTLARGGNTAIQLSGFEYFYVRESTVSFATSENGKVTDAVEIYSVSNLETSSGTTVVLSGSTLETAISNQTQYKVYSNAPIKVEANATGITSSYKFYGWMLQTTEGTKLLSNSRSAELKVDADGAIYPLYLRDTDCLFRVTVYLYDNWDTAFAKAGTTDVVILEKSGTLTDGTYAIGANQRFLVPCDSNYVFYTSQPGEVSRSAYSSPSAFRELILQSGATITIAESGAMSVAGKVHLAGGGDSKSAATSGPCGYIKMESGSQIVVNGSLYAYGYIYGNGTVSANSTAHVHEVFELGENRGGTALLKMVLAMGSRHIFPISQYYIQNIEVPLTMHSGAMLDGHAAIEVDDAPQHASVTIIGQSAGLFRLSNGTITKTYLTQEERCRFDVDGMVTVSTIVLELDYSLDSSNCVLPINGHIDINIKGGTATIGSNVEFLPGVKLTIDQGASLEIASGKSLYVYDLDEWGNYVYYGADKPYTLAAYSPSSGKPTKRNHVDACIDVNGTLTVNGSLYTTSSGADIISSEGTGKVTFTVAANSDSTIYQYAQVSGEYKEITVTSAKLHNGGQNRIYEDNATKQYTVTAGTAAGEFYTYCNTCEMWVKGASGLAHIIKNGEVVGHAATLDEAKTDYGSPEDGKYIQMLGDTGESVALQAKTALDLNGKKITGTTTISGAFYGADTSGNGYDVPSGSINLSAAPSTVAYVNGRNYVAYKNTDDTYSFYRCEISPETFHYYFNEAGHSHLAVEAKLLGHANVLSKIKDIGFAALRSNGKTAKERWYLTDTEAEAIKLAGNTNVTCILLDYGTSDEEFSTEFNILAKLDFSGDHTNALITSDPANATSFQEVYNPAT